MSVAARTDVIRERRLCFNCLYSNHSSRICKAGKCRICSRKHHTLLHPPNVVTPTTTNSTWNATVSAAPVVLPSPSIGNVNTHHTTAEQELELPTNVLLATASVTVQAQDGSEHFARALLDTGSQASFISESYVQLLKLKRNQASVRVNGLGSSEAGTSRGIVRITIGSQYDPTMHLVIDALVLNRITAYLPTRDIHLRYTWTAWSLPTNNFTSQEKSTFYWEPTFMAISSWTVLCEEHLERR